MLNRVAAWLGRHPQPAAAPVDPNPCSPMQCYPGYQPQDMAMLQQFVRQQAVVNDDHYVDGFGVKTHFNCVPFVDPAGLNTERLTLPFPDDGFHAEGIEYVAITDAVARAKAAGRQGFCAVEAGAGWGPWLGLAGVLARQHAMNDIYLLGAEASEERFALMQQHMAANALDEADGVALTLFRGAVWKHDGEVQFPKSDVVDMGAAATEEATDRDYRGHEMAMESVPCMTLASLCAKAETVDFLHMDLQGAELTVIENDMAWLCRNVRTMMVATHSRSIEGALMPLLSDNGWSLHREKPCRFRLAAQVDDWVGLTEADGSQYWTNNNFT